MNIVLLFLILVDIIGTLTLEYRLIKVWDQLKAYIFPGQDPEDYEKILKELQNDGGNK